MKITVCELNTAADAFTIDWNRLVAHVKSRNSDLVLLPEMPFYPWFAGTHQVDPMIWEAAVTAHDKWEARLQELAPAIVLGSRPVNQNDKRLNQGFVWESPYGCRAAHTKYYLPDVQGFWEASWYDRGNGNFTPVQTSKAQVGFAICTDIWFTEHARAYGKKGFTCLPTRGQQEKPHLKNGWWPARQHHWYPAPSAYPQIIFISKRTMTRS